MSRTDGKGRRLESDYEENVKYLRKPQRSHSVSPELHSRIKSVITTTKDAGAVDEEQFRLGFEDVKQMSFSSGYELEKSLMSIHAILSNTNEDWEKRVDQLKRFRGFVIAGAADHKEFPVAMRYMDLALQTSVKDLRSQVVREACISIAFLATTLGLKCERTAEMLLPTLILLIPNSARVMSSSGLVTIRLLLMYVHSHKLIPIITQECLASKSKETRRACCEFVKITLSSFPKPVLERHLAGLRETLKKSMSDADSETRALARQAYAAFAVIFPVQARDMYRELDLPKQRLLNEAGFGPSLNHNSIVSTTPASTSTFKARTVLKSTTVDDFDTIRSPVQSSSKSTIPNPTFRSISAVDAGAARRARARFAPQTSHPAGPLIKSSFGRGLATPLQRSIRKDVVEKRTFLSMQKKPLAGLSGDMERLSLGGDERMDLGLEQPSQLVTDISGVVALLASSNWLTKRDGLINLQHSFRQGKPLLPSELELLRSSFARLIADPSTKLVGTVIDTLYDFVRIHNLQIGSWLYQLLTKLWYRQGSDVTPIVQTKVERLLLLIRESFPAEVQFQHVMRFLTDMSSQSSAFRIKLVVLDYLLVLIQNVPMQSGDLKNSSVTRLGITKIITWTVDSKASMEVRQSCQTILVLLNHLNSKEFVDIIDTLEQDVHKTAIKMISTYPRRPSTTSEDFTLKRIADITTPLIVSPLKEPVMPVSEGRYTLFTNQSAGTPGLSLVRKGMPNDENRNPVATGLDGRNGTFERLTGQEDLNRGSDIGGVSPVPEDIQNNLEEQVRYLTSWSDKFVTSSKGKQRQLLEHLHFILPMIKEEVWQGHFMTVLPLLYDLLHSSGHDNEIISGTLVCFADLLRLRPNQMRQLPELTVVNLLEIQRNASKAVTKACDECLKLAVHVFPCDVVVKILSPIIINQPPPENAAAVRFFSLICQDTHDKSSLIPTLPLIAPILVSAYAKSEESTMRKECVYGLIYLQLSVGEDLMEPYYQELSASKIRLMNVYLKRIVQG